MTSLSLAPAHPELNAFLYADIGAERQDMPLSVLSALARLGVDPWEEAARLAHLPRTTAAASLARLIAATPGLWAPSDAPGIASRLVGLLSPQSAKPTPGAATLLPRERQWLVPAGLLATLLVGLLLSVGFQERPPAASVAAAPARQHSGG
jgi:hypothetical protein